MITIKNIKKLTKEDLIIALPKSKASDEEKNIKRLTKEVLIIALLKSKASDEEKKVLEKLKIKKMYKKS